MSLTEQDAPKDYASLYIQDQLDRYDEPERKGTPRGSAVGVSKNKFHAALLLSLTNRTPKDIAQEVGVSYGLLRKWSTEPEFKRVKTRTHAIFSQLVENYIVAQIDMNLAAYKAHFRLSSRPAPHLKEVQNTLGIINRSVLRRLIIRLGNMEPMQENADMLKAFHAKFGTTEYYTFVIYFQIIEKALYNRIRDAEQFQKKGTIYYRDVDLYKMLLKAEMLLISGGMYSGAFTDKDIKVRAIISELFEHMNRFLNLISGNIFSWLFKDQ